MKSETPESKGSNPNLQNNSNTGDAITAEVGEAAHGVIVGKNIIQIGALKIPLPVALGMLILIILGVAGIGMIAKNTTPPPTPTVTPPPTATPLAFATQADGETLIIIATFHNTAPTNSEAYIKIRRAIATEAAKEGEQKLRVEVEPTELTADQRLQAEALGKRYNASMVIWGEDTGIEIIVNFLNLKEPNLDNATINETERTQLANPSAYGRFITNDLPQEMGFFSFFAIGQAYYLNTQYALAIERIEAAVALVPPDAQPEELAHAYFLLGWLYEQKPGKFDAAIADYAKAIELDPQETFAYYNRGIAYDAQGQFDKAIADYAKAIELHPRYPPAYMNRGIDYYEQGQFDKAIADYAKAIELDPQYELTYYNRGLAYTAQGQFDKAIIDYNQAIQLSSNDTNKATVYDGLCWCYSLQQRPQLALPNCQRAVELDPIPGHYDSRGLAYALSGDFKAALADFQRYVTWLEKQTDAQSTMYLAERKVWITALRSGNNPFTQEVLKGLRKE